MLSSDRIVHFMMAAKLTQRQFVAATLWMQDNNLAILSKELKLNKHHTLTALQRARKRFEKIEALMIDVVREDLSQAYFAFRNRSTGKHAPKTMLYGGLPGTPVHRIELGPKLNLESIATEIVEEFINRFPSEVQS